MKKLLAACLYALGLFSLAAESHARDMGDLGSRSGSGFRQTCHGTDVLIGFSMKTGSALDAINPICINLSPQRTWIQAYELAWKGGGGGGYQKLACQFNYAVRHLHVYTDRNGAVNHIRITCQDLNSGDWSDEVPAFGGEATRNKRFSCDDGEWATGIYGRAGGLVNRLGLQCEPR
jgi:hypothetical protein